MIMEISVGFSLDNSAERVAYFEAPDSITPDERLDIEFYADYLSEENLTEPIERYVEEKGVKFLFSVHDYLGYKNKKVLTVWKEDKLYAFYTNLNRTTNKVIMSCNGDVVCSDARLDLEKFLQDIYSGELSRYWMDIELALMYKFEYEYIMQNVVSLDIEKVKQLGEQSEAFMQLYSFRRGYKDRLILVNNKGNSVYAGLDGLIIQKCEGGMVTFLGQYALDPVSFSLPCEIVDQAIILLDH